MADQEGYSSEGCGQCGELERLRAAFQEFVAAHWDCERELGYSVCESDMAEARAALSRVTNISR